MRLLIRSARSGFGVQAPQVLSVDVSMDVVVPSSVTVQQAQSAIQSVVAKDIASMTVGDGYPYSRLSYLAYAGAGVSVTSVLNVRLNGGQADIPANGNQALVVGNIQINVTQG